MMRRWPSCLAVVAALGTLGGNPACMTDRRCEWNRESDRPLDLTTEADQLHLRADARAAEEMAVRLADRDDTVTGHRAATERCEARLFESIARIHHVTAEQVRLALRRQNDMPCC